MHEFAPTSSFKRYLVYSFKNEKRGQFDAQEARIDGVSWKLTWSFVNRSATFYPLQGVNEMDFV